MIEVNDTLMNKVVMVTNLGAASGAGSSLLKTSSCRDELGGAKSGSIVSSDTVAIPIE